MAAQNIFARALAPNVTVKRKKLSKRERDSVRFNNKMNNDVADMINAGKAIVNDIDNALDRFTTGEDKGTKNAMVEEEAETLREFRKIMQDYITMLRKGFLNRNHSFKSRLAILNG